jgi:DNA-binding NtrC family response regulator
MQSCKILLIDDEVELVTTLVERLEIRGIEAEAVTNGHDAIEKMCTSKYEVVVADLKMPGLSGVEVINFINRRYPDINVILITGHGNTESDENEDIIEGVFEILMKPFDINQLVQTIKRALPCEKEQ